MWPAVQHIYVSNSSNRVIARTVASFKRMGFTQTSFFNGEARLYIPFNICLLPYWGFMNTTALKRHSEDECEVCAWEFDRSDLNWQEWKLQMKTSH